MKVYGILEGLIDNTSRICNPAIYDFHVCETGFRTEREAEENLIVRGWKNSMPNYVRFALGSGAWVKDGTLTDGAGDEANPVAYVFEMEVDE